LGIRKKCQIESAVSSEKLRRLVPPRFRERVSLMPTSAECFDLLVLAHDESDVSHSATVAKALAKIPISQCQLVALGWNLTAAALALFEERGAIVFRLSEFPWTDESHENIKVFSASKVKRP
jgi:hypothetical protein